MLKLLLYSDKEVTEAEEEVNSYKCSYSEELTADRSQQVWLGFQTLL